MDEIEQRLHSAHLAAPSAELDRRIEDAFAAATRRAPAASRRPALWWLAATAAVAGGMAAIFLLARRPLAPHPSQTIVYHVEAQGRLREMLLTPAGGSDTQPAFVLQVSTPK